MNLDAIGGLLLYLKRKVNMKTINRMIIAEGIIFVIAGVITVWVGKMTLNSFGTILLLCGLAPLAIGTVSDAGPRYQSMSNVYRPKLSVSQQHSKDKKEIFSKTSFLKKSVIVGGIPVLVGLLLMYL